MKHGYIFGPWTCNVLRIKTVSDKNNEISSSVDMVIVSVIFITVTKFCNYSLYICLFKCWLSIGFRFSAALQYVLYDICTIWRYQKVASGCTCFINHNLQSCFTGTGTQLCPTTGTGSYGWFIQTTSLPDHNDIPGVCDAAYETSVHYKLVEILYRIAKYDPCTL